MSCSHVDSCPLHPRLNASLAGWKTSYCDTEDTWLECARHQTSLTGKPVPLALLPNGKVLGILAGASANSDAPRYTQAVAGGGVAVLTDVEADVALTEVAKRGFFGRFRKFFCMP